MTTRACRKRRNLLADCFGDCAAKNGCIFEKIGVFLDYKSKEYMNRDYKSQ